LGVLHLVQVRIELGLLLRGWRIRLRLIPRLIFNIILWCVLYFLFFYWGASTG